MVKYMGSINIEDASFVFVYVCMYTSARLPAHMHTCHNTSAEVIVKHIGISSFLLTIWVLGSN